MNVTRTSTRVPVNVAASITNDERFIPSGRYNGLCTRLPGFAMNFSRTMNDERYGNYGSCTVDLMTQADNSYGDISRAYWSYWRYGLLCGRYTPSCKYIVLPCI